MDTNVPSEVISIHNEMVLELSDNMTALELENLKHLLGDNLLTMADMNIIKTVQELFAYLMDKTFIFYGEYEKLEPKLELIKPSLCLIVKRNTAEISRKLKLKKDTPNEIVILMDKPVYHTREGSEAVFLDCTVDPLPESIEWRRAKIAPPTTRLPNNNRKYYYSPSSPTLVIRDPNKTMDEAHYKCTAETNGKSVDGDIVQLQISTAVVETTMSEPSTNITGTSEDSSHRGQLSAPEFELTQQQQDKEKESSEHTRRSDTRPQRRKRSSSTTNPGGKRAAVSHPDQGSCMSFHIYNDIDINRKESESDISGTFGRVTRQQERMKRVKLKKKCIQVCIDIMPARSPSEPSSLHLAEEFKHYLLDGGTIQLTDESCTVLDVDKDSFQITPQNEPDGFPYVNISHGQFTVLVGKTAIIQTYVIASPEVTSIQWFKIEYDDNIPIEIDNKVYFGGSDLSPSLIIRETNTDDQGQYLCLATNINGTGSSDISVLSVQSGQELTSSPDETVLKQSEEFKPKEQRDIRGTTGQDATKATAEIYGSVRIKGQTTCTHHIGRQLEFFCETCNELVCVKCPSTLHKSHATSGLDTIISQKKQDIRNFIDKTKNVDLVQIEEYIISTDTELKENTSNFEKLSDQIKRQTNKLKEELDLLSSQTLSLYKQMEEDNDKVLQTYKQDLEMYSIQLKQKIQECKKALQSGSKIEIYDAGCEIHFQVTFPIKPTVDTADFRPNRNLKAILEKALEELDTSTLLQQPSQARTPSVQQWSTRREEVASPVYTLLPETRVLKRWEAPCEITSLCPTPDGQVWTSCDDSDTLTLLDRSSNIVQEVHVNTWITDISFSPTTNTLWVCDDIGNITELVSGRLEDRFNTTEEPLCICITASSHVIVGMEGKISKFTEEGKLVCSTLDAETEEPLVGLPNQVSVCQVTHNIAVVDVYHGEEGKTCVVVMDTYFNKLFIYDGKVPNPCQHTPMLVGKPFVPTGVAYDSMGNLVIGDHYNRRVLLINGRGEFLRIIHKDDNFTHAIGLDREGVVWAVFGLNNVKLLEY